MSSSSSSSDSITEAASQPAARFAAHALRFSALSLFLFLGFCLTARKGAHGFLDALNSLIVDVGFVIEGGREGNEDELPEQILACAHIAHLDPLNAKSLAYYIDVGKKERAKRMAK